MKKYDINGRLTKVVCNGCGQNIPCSGNIIIGAALSFRAEWGYFSDKDGQVHNFDICENCYDKIVKNFTIPVDIQEKTEFL